MNIVEVPVDKISTELCVRKGYGDITTMMRSIGSYGLLQPVGLTQKYQLVYGCCRLEACRRMGWKTVPAVFIPDDARAYRAQRVENEVRRELTPEEMTELASRIEEEVSAQNVIDPPSAIDDNKSCSDSQVCNNCYKPDQEVRAAKSSQRKDTEIAKAAGFGSHMDYQRTRTVLEIGCQSLIDAMNRKQVSISAAAQLAKLPREQQEQLDYKDPKSLRQTAKAIREQGIEALTEEEASCEDVRKVAAVLERMSINQLYDLRTTINRRIDQLERSHLTLIDGDKKD